jgi:hypothetical protein
MRKHKSVVAILLAVMMIFTFMPTMAFATTITEDTTTYDWSKDFSTVTVNKTTSYNAKNNQDSEIAGVRQAFVEGEAIPPVYYYNLTTAHAVGTVKGTKIDYNQNDVPNVSLEIYNAMVATGLNVNVTSGATSTQIGYGSVNWKANVTGTALEPFEGNKVMTLTATFEAKDSSKDNNGKSATSPVLYKATDDPITFKVNVIGKTTPVVPTDFDFRVDGDKNTTYPTTQTTTYPRQYGAEYDGASHTLELLPVTGYTAKYEVYDKTSGLWTATSAIEYKDVNKKGYADYRGYYVNDSTGKKYEEGGSVKYATVTPNVLASKAVLSFAKDGNGGNFTYNVTAGSLWNAEQFIVAYNYTTAGYQSTPQSISDSQKAVLADQEALLAYFKDYYEITQKSSQAQPDVINLTFKAKDTSKMSDAEKKELEKKYEQLLANYGGTIATPSGNNYYGGSNDFSASATVNCLSTPNTKDDDITFTSAPNKTIKVKKAKKTKKAASFSVAAIADSGNAITYVLTSPTNKIVIDSATGKITVKKGLKKGTYKLTVKAKTAAGNGYKAAKESVQVTVKVKK